MNQNCFEKSEFEDEGYSLLPGIIRNQVANILYTYSLKAAESKRASRLDSQVLGTPSVYADPVMDYLLSKLKKQFEIFSSRRLHPTYSYFRLYRHGDVLTKHKDRRACEISVSLCLGGSFSKPWPFWVQGRTKTTSAELFPGDALLYRGTECIHWREQFEGEQLAQVFLHYVDKDGPMSDCKYDGRRNLTRLRHIEGVSDFLRKECFD